MANTQKLLAGANPMVSPNSKTGEKLDIEDGVFGVLPSVCHCVLTEAQLLSC